MSSKVVGCTLIPVGRSLDEAGRARIRGHAVDKFLIRSGDDPNTLASCTGRAAPLPSIQQDLDFQAVAGPAAFASLRAGGFHAGKRASFQTRALFGGIVDGYAGNARSVRIARNGRNARNARNGRNARSVRNARNARNVRNARNARNARNVRHARNARHARPGRAPPPSFWVALEC